MKMRKAALVAVMAGALGLPAAAQQANQGALSSERVPSGAMGEGVPSNPTTPRTQGVPGEPGRESRPGVAQQGPNQLGMQNQGGTQGITIQPGQTNQPGTLVDPSTGGAVPNQPAQGAGRK